MVSTPPPEPITFVIINNYTKPEAFHSERNIFEPPAEGKGYMSYPTKTFLSDGEMSELALYNVFHKEFPDTFKEIVNIKAFNNYRDDAPRYLGNNEWIRDGIRFDRTKTPFTEEADYAYIENCLLATKETLDEVYNSSLDEVVNVGSFWEGNVHKKYGNYLGDRLYMGASFRENNRITSENLFCALEGTCVGSSLNEVCDADYQYRRTFTKIDEHEDPRLQLIAVKQDGKLRWAVDDNFNGEYDKGEYISGKTVDPRAVVDNEPIRNGSIVPYCDVDFFGHHHTGYSAIKAMGKQALKDWKEGNTQFKKE